MSENLELEEVLERLVAKKVLEMQPHKCQTCGWWQRFDVVQSSFPVAGNCLCPDPIEVEGSTCMRWKPK